MCPESSVTQPSGGAIVNWPDGSLYGVGSAARKPKNGSRNRLPTTSAESSRLDQRPRADAGLSSQAKSSPPCGLTGGAAPSAR